MITFLSGLSDMTNYATLVEVTLATPCHPFVLKTCLLLFTSIIEFIGGCDIEDLRNYSLAEAVVSVNIFYLNNYNTLFSSYDTLYNKFSCRKRSVEL